MSDEEPPTAVPSEEEATPQVEEEAAPAEPVEEEAAPEEPVKELAAPGGWGKLKAKILKDEENQGVEDAKDLKFDVKALKDVAALDNREDEVFKSTGIDAADVVIMAALKEEKDTGKKSAFASLKGIAKKPQFMDKMEVNFSNNTNIFASLGLSQKKKPKQRKMDAGDFGSFLEENLEDPTLLDEREGNTIAAMLKSKKGSISMVTGMSSAATRRKKLKDKKAATEEELEKLKQNLESMEREIDDKLNHIDEYKIENPKLRESITQVRAAVRLSFNSTSSGRNPMLDSAGTLSRQGSTASQRLSARGGLARNPSFRDSVSKGNDDTASEIQYEDPVAA